MELMSLEKWSQGMSKNSIEFIRIELPDFIIIC